MSASLCLFGRYCPPGRVVKKRRFGRRRMSYLFWKHIRIYRQEKIISFGFDFCEFSSFQVLQYWHDFPNCDRLGVLSIGSPATNSYVLPSSACLFHMSSCLFILYSYVFSSLVAILRSLGGMRHCPVKTWKILCL